MTIEMKQKFEQVFLEAVKILRDDAPKDTGNLAYNAIKYKWVNDSEFVVYVDVGDVANIKVNKYIRGLAPYMPFTNEPWLSSRWNGKKNPNENWWNDAISYIIRYIGKRLGGEFV